MAGGNAIASGSAILTANADGLVAGLNKAEAGVKGWGSRVGGFMGKLGGGLLKAGPLAMIGAVAEVMAAPLAKLDEFGKLSKQAAGVGIGASQFQGLTQQFERFGVDADQATLSFQKFGAKLTDAAQFGAPQASAAFARLGLDAKELASLPLDQAFLKVSDAIQTLGSPAQQAHAAISLFGKSGTQLLPVLQKGGAAIQDFINEQKSLGAVLGDDQLKKAADASKAWKSAKKTISAAWDGLAGEAAVSMAPLIEFGGNALKKVFALARPVFEWYGRAAETYGKLLTFVVDQIGVAVEATISFLAGLGGSLGGVFGELPTIQEVMVAVFRGVGVAAAYAWDTIKGGAGIIAIGLGQAMQFAAEFGSVFDGAVKVVAKGVVWVIKGIEGVANAFKWVIKQLADAGAAAAKKLGLGDTEAKFRGVSEAADKITISMADTREEIDKWASGVDVGKAAMKAGRDLEKWGDKAVDEFGDGAKKFNAALDAALAPKEKGKEIGKEIAAGMEEEIATGGAVKLSGALARGGKEAYSLIVKNSLRGMEGGDSPIKNLVGETKKGNGHHKNNGKKLDKAVDLLANIEAI